MKILVTGGAGFIGSHVVDSLVSIGHEVIVVDNLSTGKKDHINPAARFYEADIRDCRTLEMVFEKERPDLVNHHAAQVDLRRSVRKPVFDTEVNLIGSLNLIELAKRYKVKDFIYISTGGAIYGEPRYLPVDESHPIEPISPYGINKHTVEHYLSINGSEGLNYIVLRYPNVYGPRQDPAGEAGVVAVFSTQMLRGQRPTIFGDGSKTRDYVYVSDIVKANILAIGSLGMGGCGEAFNIGWGKEVSDLEIFDAVRAALGVDIAPIYDKKRTGEIDRICLQSAKIKKCLGWEPMVGLKEGIRLTTGYYKSQITMTRR